MQEERETEKMIGAHPKTPCTNHCGFTDPPLTTTGSVQLSWKTYKLEWLTWPQQHVLSVLGHVRWPRSQAPRL